MIKKSKILSLNPYKRLIPDKPNVYVGVVNPVEYKDLQNKNVNHKIDGLHNIWLPLVDVLRNSTDFIEQRFGVCGGEFRLPHWQRCLVQLRCH